MNLINSLVYYILFVTVIIWTNGQLLGLPEGSSCGNAGGTCKRLQQCPVVGNPRQTRPLICSFVGRDPVVCCPPPNSKALQMCMLYDRMACNGVEVARKRRDTELELEIASTTTLKDDIDNGDQAEFTTTAKLQFDIDLTTEKSGITSKSDLDLTTRSMNMSSSSTTQTNSVTISSTTTVPTTLKYITTRRTKPCTSTPSPFQTSTPSSTQTSIHNSRTSTQSVITAPISTISTTTHSPTIVEEPLLSNSTMKEVDAPRMLPPGFSLSSVSDNNIPEKKIVGGTEATARELPYMALIGFGVGSVKEWSCGGSIISENFILSAAHCAKNAVLGPARWARVAELDLSRDNSPHLDIPIIARFVHPNYKEPAVYNDIALFRLGTRLSFSSWVQPLCLQVASDIQDRKGVAAGWGRTDFVGDTSERLLKVDLTLVDSGQCRNIMGRAGRFLPQGVNMDTMICAGEVQGGKDTCTGDSGGPFVIQGSAQCLRTQVGIVSFGRECAKPNTPGIYTKVSSFIPWIESIVWP